LSFNDLYDIPSECLCHQHLYELYLSGNQLASLPADDIEKLSYLRVLAVNGNKLQTLPAEIKKLRKLLVLDVGSNVLKYNIANLDYDWNWYVFFFLVLLFIFVHTSTSCIDELFNSF
jgi:adenylate cyclase